MRQNIFKICSLGLLAMGCQVFADNTATQTLTLNVPISQSITVSSSTVTLSIPSLDGSGSGVVSSTGLSYNASATADTGELVITGVLATAMPTDSVLAAHLASNSGTSAGSVNMTATPQNLVTGLNSSDAGFSDAVQSLTLTFGVSGGYVGGASLSNTITYTITSG